MDKTHAMSPSREGSPEDLLRDLRAAFRRTLTSHPDLEPVLVQAWDSFEGNVAIQSEGQAPIACHKGCPSCCSLRVGATTPEVLLIAVYLQMTAPALRKHGIDLIRALRDADSRTRGFDENARVVLREACPFIVQGVCVIHRVRPLACRGHASHDKLACVEAAAGQRDEVPFSDAHRTVRAVVQTALQAALRAEGRAWGMHELNHATVLALDLPDARTEWERGGDPLAAASIDSDQRQAMGDWLDQW